MIFPLFFLTAFIYFPSPFTCFLFALHHLLFFSEALISSQLHSAPPFSTLLFFTLFRFSFFSLQQMTPLLFLLHFISFCFSFSAGFFWRYSSRFFTLFKKNENKTPATTLPTLNSGTWTLDLWFHITISNYKILLSDCIFSIEHCSIFM